MDEVIYIEPEKLNRATLLLNRTNNVIKRLNSIAGEIVQYETQSSIFIVANEKLSQSIGVTKQILKDIESLIEEEKDLRYKLKTLSILQYIKKRNYNDRIDEIVSTINHKQAQLAELEKDQKKLNTKINCAKHLMSRTENASKLYLKIALSEYNPLIENLNSTTSLDIEPITGEKIEPLQTFDITFKILNQEEIQDENIYE